jgi:HSP20 family molecular chaperone IbpA
MKTFRATIKRVPTKAIRTHRLPASASKFHTHAPKMSLFPRFGDFSDITPIFRIMDEYDRVARGLTREATQSLRAFQPKFDVKETKDSYELHGELPGVEQKDVEITWQDGNTLSISGRAEHRVERKQGVVEDEEHKPKQPTVEDEKDEGKKETLAVTATGSKEVQKKPEEEGRYWITERSVGEFHRSFSFPSPVDHDNVKATMKNGVLSVIVPKARRTQPKRINIE